MKKYLKLAIVVITFAVIGTVTGQIESTEPAANAAAETVLVKTEISAFDFFIKGGVFLIPICLLLFYTIFVTVEKYRYIKRTARFDSNLLNNIKSNLTAGNLEPAITIVSGDKTAFGQIVKEGLYTVGRPVSEIESNMDKVTNIEIGKMENRQ